MSKKSVHHVITGKNSIFWIQTNNTAQLSENELHTATKDPDEDEEFFFLSHSWQLHQLSGQTERRTILPYTYNCHHNVYTNILFGDYFVPVHITEQQKKLHFKCIVWTSVTVIKSQDRGEK